LHKQALVLESSLNRHALRAELHELHRSTAWISNATQAPQRFAPLLVLLAPLAGFLVVRGRRRTESLFSRLVSAAKWIGPIYSLWRGYSTARKQAPDAAQT
jgi:hypothetical protein